MKQSEFDFERAIKQFDKLFNEVERLNIRVSLLEKIISEQSGAEHETKRVVYSDSQHTNKERETNL